MSLKSQDVSEQNCRLLGALQFATRCIFAAIERCKRPAIRLAADRLTRSRKSAPTSARARARKQATIFACFVGVRKPASARALTYFFLFSLVAALACELHAASTSACRRPFHEPQFPWRPRRRHEVAVLQAAATAATRRRQASAATQRARARANKQARSCENRLVSRLGACSRRFLGVLFVFFESTFQHFLCMLKLGVETKNVFAYANLI